MTRLLVHVEGETEETFVNEVLAPHLYTLGYTAVSARLIGNARQRYKRGGIQGWHAVRKEILAHLKGDSEAVATTMVDYYALPQGDLGWPGREIAVSLEHDNKPREIEARILNDVSSQLGDGSRPDRFVPFILMHEFEALLFSDCAEFADAIGHAQAAPLLQSVRSAFSTPEHINDSPVTAPSKRVEAIIPGYQKPLHGNLAAIQIGLQRMRSECPHFAAWLDRLEAIPGSRIVGH